MALGLGAALHTRAEWLEFVPTFRWPQPVPATPGKLEELLEGIGAAIDTIGGRFTMGYAAVTVTAARTGA